MRKENSRNAKNVIIFASREMPFIAINGSARKMRKMREMQ